MLDWVAHIKEIIQPYWVIVVAVAVPVAGFVGFLANLGSLKKVRLENEKLVEERQRTPQIIEKLELEIRALKRAAAEAEEKATKESRLVKPANMAEMREEYLAEQRFLRETRPPSPASMQQPSPREAPPKPRLLSSIGLIALLVWLLYEAVKWFAQFLR